MSKEAASGAAFLVAVGLALSGWFIGNGFVKSRTADRFVSVKGLAERDVTADKALWPIRFTASSDDLATAQAAIEKSKQTIMAFLGKHGIDADHIEVQSLSVTDARAQTYSSGQPGNRFVISQTIIARSDTPAQIQGASQGVDELVSAGVVLSTGEWGAAPTYLFTRLNDLKPSMIAEATGSARDAAVQFAKDSGSGLGGIRNASQGVFQILPRDRAPGIQEANQLNKTVRVVTTIEYYLED